LDQEPCDSHDRRLTEPRKFVILQIVHDSVDVVQRARLNRLDQEMVDQPTAQE
jgi:hypothetical protein